MDYIQSNPGHMGSPRPRNPDGLHFNSKCYKIHIDGQPLRPAGVGEAFHRIPLGGFAAADRQVFGRRWLTHLHR